MFSEVVDKIFSTISSVPFDTLAIIILGSYAGIFLLVFFASLINPKLRVADKRPYLCFTNAYAAIVLAAFLTVNDLSQAILVCALFWFVGYLSYGLLCAISKPKAYRQSTVAQVAVTSMPSRPPQKTSTPPVPPSKNNVRLEHAISVTDKLLQKELGKGDRQELEKLKNTLAVFQMKGTLSPIESDYLNEHFNALLKLMAKYNI